MTIYIDNEKIEANAGETIIAAAQRSGINVPHFCWHPEMSVAGNCRMCLVEVGTPKRNPDGSFVYDDNQQLSIAYMPKLQIACNTMVSDEMRVHINTAKVINARSAVMEFILINHPLDCPICDEAGGCKLQEYSTCHSKNGSRFTETKNENIKRTAWNSKIIYDAERCISCSRCIRFTRDIMKEDILTFLNRGDKVRVHRFQDRQIENDYSMNIIDSCPVGALTSNDFRFKARVWEMSFNHSICTNCGRGCNISVGVRNNEILRVQPSPNIYVNKYWMCDAGRLSLADRINNKRLTSPQIRKDGMKSVNWDEAINEIIKVLKKTHSAETFIIASPFSSNESNYLISLLANEGIKTDNIGYIPRIDENFGDSILKTNTKAPNMNGLETIGIKQLDIQNLIEKINSETIKTILVLDEDFSFAPDLAASFARLQTLILCGTNRSKADIFANIILPVASFVEYEGTFTNIDNRVQHFTPAIITADNITPIEAIRLGINRSRLDIFGEKNDKWNQKPIMNIKPGWWLIKEILKAFINIPDYQSASEIFADLVKNNNKFEGMDYALLDKHQGLILEKASTPDPVINNYYSHSFYKK